jgi:hypothetical protein
MRHASEKAVRNGQKGVGSRDCEKAPSSSGKQEPKRCRCGDAFFAVRPPCCEADGFPVGAGAEGCVAHDDVGA